MWKVHDFETIFNYNDVMNIKDYIGKGFGSQERAYYMGVDAYFFSGEKIDHMQHLTMYLENKSLEFIITYRYIVFQKNWLIYK